MSILRPAYRVVRGIIISLILLAVVVYVAIYVVLSIPSFQTKLKDTVCKEFSVLLGGKVVMERLTISPFSEVLLTGVSLYSPDGEKCISIGKMAAGIDLWTLLSDRKIALNYAEIIGLNLLVEQKEESGPLNLQFLIDALSPQNKEKPSALFNLKIRNIVVRDSKAQFIRKWMVDDDGNLQRFADIHLNKLRLDLSMPVLKNDLYKFDVRNMQFDLDPGVSVRSLSGFITYFKDYNKNSSGCLAISNLKIGCPNSSLNIGDIEIILDSFADAHVDVTGSLTPSDFAQLIPALKAFDSSWDIDIDAILNDRRIVLSNLELSNQDQASLIRLRGDVDNFRKIDSLNASISALHAEIGASLLSKLSRYISPGNKKIKKILESAGSFRIDLETKIKEGNDLAAKGIIETESGSLGFETTAMSLKSRCPAVTVTAHAVDLDLGDFLETDKIGNVSFILEAEVEGIDRNAEGRVFITSDAMQLLGRKIDKLELSIDKKKADIEASLHTSGGAMRLDLDAFCHLGGKETVFDAAMTCIGVTPGDFGVKCLLGDCILSTSVQAHTKGNSADNILGNLKVNDLTLTKSTEQSLHLSELSINIDSIGASETSNRLRREMTLRSDWIDGKISGDVIVGRLKKEIVQMLSAVFPTLIPSDSWTEKNDIYLNNFKYSFNIKGSSAPYSFFNTPVCPLSDIPVSGFVDSKSGKFGLEFQTPHLLQGKDKLIRDVKLSLSVDSHIAMMNAKAGSIYPTKKGDVQLAADINALNDKVNVNIGLNPTMKSAVKGSIGLEASFSKIADPFKPQGVLAVQVETLPSIINVSNTPWSVANGTIAYSGKKVSVNHFMISHGNQYIKIDGTASENTNDLVKIRLNDIDLEYIFNLLNINYVSFGGMATGEVVGSMLLTQHPSAHTEFLHVKGLSYNGAVLGDGDLASEYLVGEQKVGIYAVIREPLTRIFRASVDGGIWVTRDSLSFNMSADRLNVGLMKPFMSAFCSELSGEASGKCKLYGTFSDIDLIGALKADTLSMKLDFTNTWYHAGGDSVFLRTGMIDIPPLTLYDDRGNSAEFSGWLKHRYFHEPEFNFRLRDAKSLLCYDTNEKINPLWYGTIYGSGHAQINGYPGLIEIDMNMTTEDGSRFYYVISDAEEVEKYSFLTFTDKRKEAKEAVKLDTVPDYLTKFIKTKTQEESFSSNVVLSLKGTVTNDALVTLVMDPKAGDNITARGQGALQMDYNLASNDLRMIGSYILDEGNYNFSLQDIIIKNFNIRKGSMITFDGDPMNANLDITATYRVNTNLTDLDKSFSTDRELNRTNVPVDALLMVKGPMTHPDIAFDIELPSLTSDVERKVKSIVSTNDMMNRQIIYLLALNRFYTPEYTESGSSGSGSEWSSMASSTISSQLSNILSQMTDKLDMAPSFRSDKGDFTDMEFDLALSSRLLNNRLLINGNFGYRDRSTSNTQFIGDFDIEYLLSKNGNLRLKAYNHFNDQNYYLRSALTTQGVGVVFRKDFDSLFRRKTHKGHSEVEEIVDSVRIEKVVELEKDTINK